MRERTRLKWPQVAGFCLLALGAQISVAQSAAPRQWPAEAIIRFSATSTLHDFGGEVAAQPFVLTIASNSWSADAFVVSARMNTANEGRDKNMYKMLNTNSHPRLHGKVTQAPMPGAGATNGTLRLKIRDQEHDLPLTISHWLETSNRLSFHAEWDLSLKQFKLKPPSVMGIVRVGDTVHLNAEVTVDKTRAFTNPPSANIVPANP
jgi:hypothetical protein